jgi:RNA polymerase sigma-70 factor, ECF subfamily
MNPDLDIVPRALAGDREALDALVPQYHREIESAVIRYLGASRPNDIEDAAQSVWVKLFERLDRFDPKRGVKFSTWLYALARNHCFDMLKKRRISMRSLTSRSPDGEEHELDLAAEGTLAPEVGASHCEFVARYRRCRDGLDDEQQSVFELRVLLGLEFGEIATLRRIPLGTAKTIFYRTAKRLRAELGPPRRAA